MLLASQPSNLYWTYSEGFFANCLDVDAHKYTC